ncbi:MAG: hypothetical protein KDK01_01665 [Rhodobacteraceae bacterium]|nr:hypothetical protein [Paracoccaceae bacterium]
MGFLAKLDHHFDLMTRMSDTVHADLNGSLALERLSASELRNAVLACTGCEGGKECPDWLDSHADGAEETPDYCRNRNLLQRLRA